jgi:predicted ATPase
MHGLKQRPNIQKKENQNMGQFNHLEIKGFRRLNDLNLELRPLCVLIGSNGSGKTSLLDVFSLLAASALGELNKKISELNGIAALRTYDLNGPMSFELAMDVPHREPLVYYLAIAPSGIIYSIEEEKLTQLRSQYSEPFMHIHSNHGEIRYFEVEDSRLVRPSWEHNPLETSLSQVPKMFREPEEFRNKLASSTYYHVLNVEPRAPVRLPQPLRPASLPGRDGEDLVSCLFYLRETNRDRYEIIEDTLRTAFPDFERLEFPPVAAGTLAMTWKDKNFGHPLYMHQLSEGTLRFLWLTTLLQSPGLTAITLLDEPEVSLHPELLNLLAGLMREASQRTQLIVATHADRLIRFLEPNEVVTFDLAEDGTTQARWADQMDIERWLSEYTLDEVWRLGRMGGRS